MRQKLNMITIGVSDIAHSKAFYDGLGWVQSDKSMDDLILYSLGGMLIALYPREELAKDIGVSSEGVGFGGITLGQNVRTKEEADEVLAQVTKLGGIVVKPAEEVFWGGYSGYFRDPDGHLFEVAYNPFWPLDDAGDVVLS